MKKEKLKSKNSLGVEFTDEYSTQNLLIEIRNLLEDILNKK